MSEIATSVKSMCARLFYQEWVAVLLIGGIAAAFRFWGLGTLPPGLYSDEAFNGLDALSILNGQHALFFEANNGREPFYIYLTSFAVRFFGRTAYAIRFPAALLGTATVFPLYWFTKAWFDRRTGLLTALLWAITLWPIHLSRVGFRSIGLPFLVACFLVAATHAFQQLKHETITPRITLFLAGGLYASLFYTYLAARLTPVFLLLFVAYALWQGHLRLNWSALFWVGLGFTVGILPFAVYVGLHREVIFGRTGQVSILSPAIHQGDIIGTFWRHIAATLGMFVWRGDTIVRHNPAGRPIFDIFMAIPFLWGVFWAIKHWRRPAAMACLLWVGTLLWGTILAEDAPHFLRSVGILPILLIFPAIGLSCLSKWSKLSRGLSGFFLIFLLIGSGGLTIRDYFIRYAQDASVYYLFESAAYELAQEINQDHANQLNILVDERFVQEWESISYLVDSDKLQTFASMQIGEVTRTNASSLYVWPHESASYLQHLFQPPVMVSSHNSSLARGDLEKTPYQLYTRYGIFPDQQPSSIVANFDNQLYLHEIVLDDMDQSAHLSIQLTWSFSAHTARELKAFVHVLDRTTETLVGQADAPIGGANWMQEWWEFDVSVQEAREIELPTRYHADKYAIIVGVYDPATLARLSIFNEKGELIGDSWEFSPNAP